MHVEIYKIYYSNYKFVAELDTGAEVGTNQVTLWFGEKGQYDFGELHFLRAFYFEEANYDNIHTFCREFALHPAYRQEILGGQRHWTRRNDLFVRNLYSVIGEEALLANDTSFERKAREFFRWIDIHTEEILALPLYQQLQCQDSLFQPDATTFDPLIKAVVTLLNQIPGVITRFSCQGISGKIQFQEYALMAVSPHMEYAYVSFHTLSYFAHDAILTLLPAFPHVTNVRIPCDFSSDPQLRSTGDNACFRGELMTMAQCILAQEHGPQMGPNLAHWETAIYPERQPKTTAPGGILPSRLTWLCKAPQIEHTLNLLFHLNHWAKASAYLFYVDRQGLYTIKTALMQQSYAAHFLQPLIYIDGIATFAKDFDVETAADIAAEFLLDRLSFLFAKRRHAHDEDKYDTAARQLFQRISGHSATCPNDVETLQLAQAETYIRTSLYDLIEQARLTRQPIPHNALSALLIGPSDLLTIPYNREHLIEYWHELDEANARKLDPEGSSLIAFRYTNATTSYTFHLPFRAAERFMPPERVRQLQLHAGHSREQGSYYGRALTEAESYEHPLAEILYELAANIDGICPRKLARKEEERPYATSLRGYWEFSDEEDDDEYGEEEEEEEYITYNRSRRSKHARRNKHRAQRHLKSTCPLCKCSLADSGLTPMAHWYQSHPEQDLTIGQATWVLGESESTLKIAGLKPDYYGPISQSDHNSARYWKLATLQTYAAQKKHCSE